VAISIVRIKSRLLLACRQMSHEVEKQKRRHKTDAMTSFTGASITRVLMMIINVSNYWHHLHSYKFLTLCEVSASAETNSQPCAYAVYWQMYLLYCMNQIKCRETNWNLDSTA